MREIINERTVMQFFIEQAREDRIVFLKGHETQKEKICGLVQELMDADTMNQKIRVACQLWKLLFAASMSYVSPERQGYDKIFQYYDAYVEFEELIFASDSFYRDHTLHSIWVYFLGEYVHRSEEFQPLFEDERQELRSYDVVLKAFKTIGVEKKDLELCQMAIQILKELRDYQEATRCVAALAHDLGYPLKKIEKINKSMQKVLPFFAVHSASVFSFEYSSIQKNFVDQFLDFISRRINLSITIEAEDTAAVSDIMNRIFIYKGKREMIGVNEDAVAALSEEEKEMLLESISFGWNFKEMISARFASSNDFEEYQHGIMSAFLLQKNLSAFQRISYSGRNGGFYNGDIDTAQLLALHEILHSMAAHTNKLFRITSIDSANYLTFIDELEEFSRISRASQNREYVKEFCDTRLYMEDGWLNIEFTFSNTSLDNLDPEISFRGRCKRFLTLFDVRQLSPNLKIRVSCIGKLPTDQNTYTLEIARKYADIRINGESVDVPAYLKSRQFSTKEEYAE